MNLQLESLQSFMPCRLWLLALSSLHQYKQTSLPQKIVKYVLTR